MSGKTFYITTAIDYVNGKPHIGHVYEKIASDVIARHFKQRGDDVYFLTGSDEHGIKIQKTAQKNNMSPKEFCDSNVVDFQALAQDLNLDYNKYIRTTDDYHEKAVQKIFQKLLEKGDIYKASYTGLYCSGCECFLAQKDLTEDGLCPDHMAKPQEVKEENYFFRLSKYKQQIIDHINANPDFILPSYRKNEILNQLENIQDISVSRPKTSVSWGIEVPGDKEQVIYVWIDALSNYITALGYESEDDSLFKKYWPANCQMIGKDILKFHSIYWIGLLLALGVKLPKTIFAHGWITIDEKKMSKSLGNVISHKSILEQYHLESPDALRYFLMTTTSFGRDGNYSDEDFKSKVNADLANNTGNLLNRSLSMLLKYFEGEIKQEFVNDDAKELVDATLGAKKKVVENFDSYMITEAIDEVISLVNLTNKYVNETAPWSLAKDENTLIDCAKVLYNVAEVMYHVAVLMYPVIPDISQKILSQLGEEKNIADIKLDDLKWGMIQPKKIIDKASLTPVFLRIDSELAGDKKK